MVVPANNGQLVPFVPLETSGQPDDRMALCIVRDTTNPQWNQCKITVNLPLRMTARDLCEDIAKQANYELDTFNLVWQRGGIDGDDNILMNDLGVHTLGEVGLLPDKKRNFFEIQDKDGIQPVPINAGATGITVTSGDDNTSAMAAAASARTSDDDTQPLITAPSIKTCSSLTDYGYGSYASAVKPKSNSGYVGLINQAMTCYLNSLLQTLYMTPEFRNALYRWCFDESVEDPAKSIPYQLQRLFVQLQTSTKRSIETYDVTKSFGWDSNEAWHQHDVQELCRVMFDALETKFKNTENEDLINRLYQGQMKDYVKCLECGHESARKDSFLDIPLVIRPFGSSKTFGSVQEALKAFITPETLNDTNQYFCEHCDKKCDAHKGLKFLSFPYILTLQLKRFDFDYTTYARLKLNDKVTFPELLNMSDLLETDKEMNEEMKSQTSEDYDFNTEHAHILGNTGRGDSSDDTIDEGIDVEQAASVTASTVPTTTPYLYELFSIMVHSGTANGGHYYAYIKSFSDGQWFCFNDTSVMLSTQDDIRRTYGIEAAPGRSAPSTTLPNAYMLMYRRVEPDKNADSTSVELFPPHIKDLMARLQREEEEERKQREIDRNTCKIKLFSIHPVTGKAVEARLEVHKDKTLREATEVAHTLLGFDKDISLDRCRLVKYDEFHESLERSFEGEDNTPMGTLLMGVKTAYMFDLLLETRREDQEFVVYRPGGVTNKVFVVDLESETISIPISMRCYVTTTIQDFKAQIAEATGLDMETMRVVLEKYYNDLKPLVVGHKTLKNEGFLKSNKVFVESSNIEDRRVPFLESRLYQLLDRHANTIRLQVTLPLSFQDDFKPPNSNSVSPCPSTTSSTDEKYNDLQLETDIALNKAPTPSPTGSSSTLSDDHPLDKHNANLVGSETDSGVVSLNDARITDDTSIDNDRNSGEMRSSPEGAVDNESGDNAPRSEVDKDVLIPEGGVQCTDANVAVDDLCWCDGRGCSDCQKLQKSDSDHGSGVTESPLSPLSSLSSPLAGTSDGKSGSIPSNTDPGAGGEASGNNTAYSETNDGSEDEIYHNTRHPKQPNWYFRAETVQVVDNSRLLPVYVDKRMSLAVFKKALEPYIGTDSQNFKVYRVYANNQEFESIRLTETLQSYSEDSRVVIKLGRALKKGEYRVKIYHLQPNSSEPCKYLFDWVFANGMSVLQSKMELIPEINSKCQLDVPLDRLRLRKKAWKYPGTIFTNSQLYEEDIPIFTNWEVFIEILDRPEPVIHPSQVVLFTRRWRPSEFKLDLFGEVILSDLTVDELKKELSKVSGLDPKDIDFAKGKGTFPCEVSLLEMQSDLEWNPHTLSLNSWPLYISDDGAVIYYRDRKEEVKELTEEEKQEIQKRESSSLDKSSQKVAYPSPRKERALKIYTDTTSSA